MIIVPDPDYRANPDRAAFVQGTIDQAMVDRLTPIIIGLTTKSRDPITVYIDSRGGSVLHKEILTRLLRAKDQDGHSPCRIITVVTNRAASAAADLLSGGHYAIAYPGSNILYHGVRASMDDPITAELGSALAESLKVGNDRFAMTLARESESRFMFRYMASRPQHTDYKKNSGQPNASELDCFIGLTKSQVSAGARRIIDRAQQRYNRYFELLEPALKVFKKKATMFAAKKSPLAKTEAAIIAKLIAFEVNAHKKDPGWSFGSGGMVSLADDFILLNEHMSNYDSEQFKRICERWAAWVLTKDQQEQLSQIPDVDENKKKKLEFVSLQFQPVWFFFVALCHVLQEGENELSASDAFFLGLIDEIAGETQHVTQRMFAEYQEDPAQAKATPAAGPSGTT